MPPVQDSRAQGSQLASSTPYTTQNGCYPGVCLGDTQGYHNNDQILWARWFPWSTKIKQIMNAKFLILLCIIVACCYVAHVRVIVPIKITSPVQWVQGRQAWYSLHQTSRSVYTSSQIVASPHPSFSRQSSRAAWGPRVNTAFCEWPICTIGSQDTAGGQGPRNRHRNVWRARTARYKASCSSWSRR